MTSIPAVSSSGGPQARRRRTIACLASTFLLTGAGPALAYWEVVPELNLGLTYESNPRYQSENEDSASGALVQMGLDMGLETPETTIRLLPRWRKTEYFASEDDDLNDDDTYLDLNASRRTERAEFGLGGSWRDQGVRTSEFVRDTDSTGAVDPSGSGRFINLEDEQRYWTVRPSVVYILSQRNTLRAGLSYSETDYREADSTAVRSYFDYDYTSADLTLAHAIDERNSLSFGVTASGYEADRDTFDIFNQPFQVQYKSDSYGVNAGYEHEFSERLTGSLQLGSARSTVDFCSAGTCVNSSADQNFVGNLSLTRRSERTRFSSSISRALAPSSNGTEIVSDRLHFRLDRNLTRLLDGSIGVIWSEDSSVGEPVEGQPFREDRTYFTLDTNVSWRLSRLWSLTGTYSYTSDEYDVTTFTNDRKNNRVFLTLRYRGIGIRR